MTDYKKDYRLQFHIMPPKGWLNDPNGLCYYEGKYHVFFQYCAENVYGGVTSWGHYVSEDLLHWEFQGEPIRPDSSWDISGAYSGCAFVDDGLMEIFYTGNVKEEGDYDYIHSGRQANTLYTSSQDGEHFTPKELLMTNADYPRDYTCHVRDPKVWKEKDVYYMVQGGRKEDDTGAVLLYQSLDKHNWTFLREYTSTEPFGYMWECPDMFVLDGHRILSASPQGLFAELYRYQNKYQSGYFLCEKEPENFVEWDMGFDFYAPQTFWDGKRRILVGWAGVPEMEEEYNNQPTIEEGWQHSLTLFRELRWRGGRIYQYPVEEYEKLRKKEIPFSKDGTEVPKTYDAQITFSQGDQRKEIRFNDSLALTYEDGVATLRFLDDTGSGRTLRNAKLAGLQDIKVMMDTSMVELYLNGGQIVLTTRWFGNTSEENSLRVIGDVSKVELWEL